MAKRPSIPPRDHVGPDTPLRLDVAAAFAYPDGSMTASGLRRERDRGRLVVERVAGKDYTTVAKIADMRKLCQIKEGAGACAFLKPAIGSLSTDDIKKAYDAALTIVRELREEGAVRSSPGRARAGAFRRRSDSAGG